MQSFLMLAHMVIMVFTVVQSAHLERPHVLIVHEVYRPLLVFFLIWVKTILAATLDVRCLLAALTCAMASLIPQITPPPPSLAWIRQHLLPCLSDPFVVHPK